MKTIFVFIGILLGMSACIVDGQIVRNPLLDYYKFIKSAGSYGDSDIHFSDQTRVYEFEADFIGNGRKAIFITDEKSGGGAHGDYSWTVYIALASGGYRALPVGIDVGINGPEYVGYIDQIQRYGIIKGGRYGICALYLDDGIIQSKVIDGARNHANTNHYPKYFQDRPASIRVSAYTLGQLRQKYAQ